MVQTRFGCSVYCRKGALAKPRRLQKAVMIFPKPPKNSGSLFSGPAARASVMGLHFVSGLLVGGGVGYMLDQWLGTRFLLWIFLPLGIAAGFMNVYRDAKRLMREQDELDAANRTRKP